MDNIYIVNISCGNSEKAIEESRDKE